MVRSRPGHAPVALVLALLALAAGTAACASIFGFERLSEDASDAAGLPESSLDASPRVDATTDAAETGASCSALGTPDRPTLVDAGAPDAPSILHMALNLIDFGIDNSVAPVGLNLDHACSPTVATSTCATSIDEATFDKYGKDKGNAGIDNAGYGLISYLGNLGTGFAAPSINDRLHNGEFGAVIRLSNWNGTPDDDDVLVEIFPAIGVWDVDAGLVPGGKPAFVASDQWMRDSRYKNIVDASIVKSATGWVTGGRLVAAFQTIALGMSVPDDAKPLDVTVQEGILYGSLVPAGTSWRIRDGIIAGRWRTSDFLGQIRQIYIKDTAGLKNVVLCDPGTPTQLYTAVKKEICDARDIRSASRDDGMKLPCDAFSTGLRIDTYPVDQPGPFADLPVLPARCTQAGSVPATDDCAAAAP